MLGRREILRTVRKTTSVIAAVCLFTACASSDVENPSAENPPSADSADALLGETAPVATDVSDAGAFADLEGAKKSESSSSESSSPVAHATTDDGAPYYNSIGGESLRRVAHTLYSDKSFVRTLLEKNPELKGIKKLAAEQKVYFDLDSTKPEPTYLTKDLLDRYPAQLADRVNAAGTEKGIAKTTVTLNRGESLQELSKRLYGTHRYWTEIFLVNHDKIQNYDRVKSGMTLSVFDRPNSGTASAAPSTVEPVAAKTETPPPVPVIQKMPEPEPTPVIAEAPVPTPAAPVSMPTQPVVEATQPEPAPAPVAVDPIPETPPVAEKAPEPAPAPVVETPKPAPAVASTEEISSSNSMTRPIIYGLLVLLIIGAGVYFTRSPKKSKVDMLDITAADSAGRPKLAKDSQKTNIG